MRTAMLIVRFMPALTVTNLPVLGICEVCLRKILHVTVITKCSLADEPSQVQIAKGEFNGRFSIVAPPGAVNSSIT
jgi:hypothetical protein